MLKTLDNPVAAVAPHVAAQRRIHPMYPFIVGAMLSGTWLAFGALADLELAILCLITTAVVTLALVLAYRMTPRGIWSVSSVYLTIFSIFHFGIAPVVGLGLPYSFDMEAILARWLYATATREALVLSLLGLTACLLGIAIMQYRRHNNANRALTGDQDVAQAILAVGVGLTVLCILAWFFYAIEARGAELLFGSYASFLAATAGTPLTLVYYGIGVGMTLLAAAPPGKWRRMGFGFFLFWCLFALPLGLRGEVLFPVAAALVIEARRRVPISTRMLVLTAVALLFMIALVREVRQAGLRGFDLSEIRVTPLDALVEMGSSLRPVVEVVRWHESGDAFLYGATYWAPFERAIFRIIPDLAAQRVDATYDERLSNILVQYRVGFIGFSPVAEAYRNGGAVAIVLVMFLVGIIIGWLDDLPATPEAQALAGVVFVPLLIQIRNSFTSVPFQMLTGALIVFSILTIARLLRKARP